MGKMENGNKNRLQAANCGFNLKETEFKNENFNYNAMLQVFLFVALTKKKKSVLHPEKDKQGAGYCINLQ